MYRVIDCRSGALWGKRAFAEKRINFSAFLSKTSFLRCKSSGFKTSRWYPVCVARRACETIMASMTTRISELKDAIDHLPPGSTLSLEDVTWKEYENLLSDLDDRPGIRVTYDQGKLEIVTTSRRHEKYERFIEMIILLMAEESGLTVESCGSATWKRQRDARGTEPDCCFHIANAERVIGRDELDLDKDPPPDLVVEIDVTNQSSSKLGIYSGFRIPEVWRYIAKKRILVLFGLQGDSYVQIERSLSFPALTATILGDFIERSASQGQTRALAAVREWLRSLH